MGKAIMVQGTASHVGKSVLVTALCRIFREDGFRVAPFKAQNMSLNSHVTPDGKEIARAQAVQAEAAGVPAEAIMNPVLLKPSADGKVQVVVLGRPWTYSSALEYRDHVPLLARVVEESLRELLDRFDVVVIEGAGSPAEVNLRDRDLANMHVAALADAPVLLLADIDRGGMLASVVGTLELLAPAERQRIAGVVVNKFRGDVELLRPGLEFLSRRTGVPVVGVLPYLPAHFVDEEDSVSLECRRQPPADLTAESPQVAVLCLPHIANFTDFAPLETDGGIRIRYVRPGEPIGQADAVILPGTKSTLADLRYLKQHGYQNELKGLLRRGVPVLGICGGYQMLGHRLADPLAADGDPGEEAGLGLLDVITVFLPEKQTHLVEAEVVDKTGFLNELSSRIIRGYEVHTGETVRLDSARPWLRIVRRGHQRVDLPEGAVEPGALVWGTYLHDIFQNQAFRNAFVSWLRRRNGLSPHLPPRDRVALGELPSEAPSASSTQDRYDYLSRVVRASLNMAFVYHLMGGPGRQGPAQLP